MRENGKSIQEINTQLSDFYRNTQWPDDFLKRTMNQKIIEDIHEFLYGKGIRCFPLIQEDRMYIISNLERIIRDKVQNALIETFEIIDYLKKYRFDEMIQGGIKAQKDPKYAKLLQAYNIFREVLENNEDYVALQKELINSDNKKISTIDKQRKIRGKINKKTEEIAIEVAKESEVDYQDVLEMHTQSTLASSSVFIAKYKEKYGEKVILCLPFEEKKLQERSKESVFYKIGVDPERFPKKLRNNLDSFTFYSEFLANGVEVKDDYLRYLLN